MMEKRPKHSTKSMHTLRDKKYFKFTENSVLEGFRRATAKNCIMKRNLGVFKAGDEVFVKLGESHDTNLFSGNAYREQKALHMVSVDTAEVEARMSVKFWTKMGRKSDEKHKTNWCTSMLSKAGFKKKTPVGLQVASIFQGIKLRDMSRSMFSDIQRDGRKARNFGKTLFQVFMYSKIKGNVDFGPFNLMVNTEGDVMLVDLACADSDKMKNRIVTKKGEETIVAGYNGKGLHTSSRYFDENQIRLVKNYILSAPCEAATFLENVEEQVVPNQFLEMGPNCPFFSPAFIAGMKAPLANNPEVQYLCNELKRRPKKDKFKAFYKQ